MLSPSTARCMDSRQSGNDVQVRLANRYFTKKANFSDLLKSEF